MAAKNTEWLVDFRIYLPQWQVEKKIIPSLVCTNLSMDGQERVNNWEIKEGFVC